MYQNYQMTKEDLIQEITDEGFEPSRPMKLGTAFHKILEDPHKHFLGKPKRFVADGIEFDYDMVIFCLESISYKEGVMECKEIKEYEINGETVQLVAKVDRLIGNQGDEHKTNWSFYKADRYINSYQWPMYLFIHELTQINYNIFEMRDEPEGIRLIKIHKFSMQNYPGLLNKCLDIISDLVTFIHDNNLESFFKYKKET